MPNEGAEKGKGDSEVRVARITRNGTIIVAVIGLLGILLTPVVTRLLPDKHPSADHGKDTVQSKPTPSMQPPSAPPSSAAATSTLPSIPPSAPTSPSFAPPDRSLLQQAGLNVKCPDQNALAAVARFSEQAIDATTPERTKGPVDLTASVGGDVIGRLPSSAIVHVACAMDDNFVVVREEQGTHEGIVERKALRPLR